ncbi:MAG: DUF192 domain-containing protein [Candidatus Micrarchaeota archaeon]|nr:DUF192 domain-containing protein [Candidatus Micrarchaeota archaeon]
MHEIANVARKKRVKAGLEIADTDFSRMRGLMFRDEIVPILFVFGFNGIFSIHSYFVKKEFDAVYLSAAGKVTEVFRRIPPNTALVSPKKKSSFLLELPVEMTDALLIKEGDVLRWKRLGGR